MPYRPQIKIQGRWWNQVGVFMSHRSAKQAAAWYLDRTASEAFDAGLPVELSGHRAVIVDADPTHRMGPHGPMPLARRARVAASRARDAK